MNWKQAGGEGWRKEVPTPHSGGAELTVAKGAQKSQSPSPQPRSASENDGWGLTAKCQEGNPG